MTRVHLISLGCDKATVDAERVAGELVRHGAEWCEDPEAADLVLVNTCAFIDAAKEESVETLLAAARASARGRPRRRVVAMGCLVERYRDELRAALPEVDLFVGLRDLDALVPELRRRGWLRGDPADGRPRTRWPVRGPQHVSFLKVSEGCDHGCAFCAIPLWRGRHRSFALEALVAEAQALEARGVVELNLVAQDLAHWGRDLQGRPGLDALLRALLRETGIPWFRLLYLYSAGLRAPLVELLATEPRIVPYLDMPIQHASDRVLRAMRRPERADALRAKIAWLRASVPGLVLRTTVLVGFPGESEEDVDRLLDFLRDVEFDRLGAFAFSPQPGTPAAAMPDPVPDAVKEERLRRVLDVQEAIAAARNADRIGTEDEAIVDAVGPEGVVARVRGQAYEVDGVTFLAGAPCDVRPGDRWRVRVTGADVRDLYAEALAPVGRAPRAAAGRGRPLPVLPLGLATAYGR